MATPSPTPFIPPPPGVESNFENPQSLFGVTTLTVGVCAPLITIFFLLRAYLMLVTGLVFISWAGTAAFCGVLLNGMAHHAGEHSWDITAEEAQEAFYWFYVCSVMYSVMICVTKLAILALYRRVFSPQRWSPFDISLLVLVAIILIFYVPVTFVKIFECDPRWKVVDGSIPGTCVNIPAVLNANGYFNTITDFFILFLPVQAVWNLQLGGKRKALLVLVFTFGLCAPAFSLVALVQRLRISNNPDATWNRPELVLWCCAELTTGNLCVCFPELGTLLRLRSGSNKPGQSILDGSYHLSESRSRSRPRRSATTAKGPRDFHRTVLKSPNGGTEGDSWLELNDMETRDMETYGVHAVVESGSEDSERGRQAPLPRPGEVVIMTEVVVDSHSH